MSAQTVTTGAGACPFCGPDGEKFAFATRDGFRAIYNIAPILPGHVMVVPERHLTSLMELDEREMDRFFSFARKVTGFVVSEFAGSGFDWSLQEGVEAGQSVAHLHLHVIPRHAGDLPHPGDWYPRLAASRSARIDDAARPRLTDDERQRIVAHLRERWAASV